ncbi:hypothetical protein PFISCL1PPCAC_2868, partial [Pristionchus fissidentatus]
LSCSQSIVQSILAPFLPRDPTGRVEHEIAPRALPHSMLTDRECREARNGPSHCPSRLLCRNRRALGPPNHVPLTTSIT